MTTQGIEPKAIELPRQLYRQPTLVKRQALTKVTAAKSVSSAAICWVARAAFGASDLRWMVFRCWLLEDAPAWFQRLYLRHGEALGVWLEPRHAMRSAIRKLMLPAVRRKLRE